MRKRAIKTTLKRSKQKTKSSTSAVSSTESSSVLSPEKSSELSSPINPERWECRKHPGHFVCPAHQKRGGHTGCYKCNNERQRSPEAKERRAKKWDDGQKLYEKTGDTSGLIWCIRHPDRQANRARYVSCASRLCGSCRNRLVDGKITP